MRQDAGDHVGTDGLARLVGLSVNEARLDATYPPGTIGVVSADLARYASFAMALCGLKYPASTTLTWRKGCDIVNSCNRLVREMAGDWLWFMGDDHVFDPNLLLRLLSRMYDDGCDIVAPLCLGRMAPFPTVIGVVDDAAKLIRVKPLAECQGLMKVDAVGSAGLLVRRRVFEAMTDPWFEAGSLTRTGLGEDWHWCLKARAAGWSIFVDAGLLLGHTTDMTIWPNDAGTETAGARLDVGEGHHVAIRHVQDGSAT